MTLYLHGVGHFHPENEISNSFLEELDIGTTDEWIWERVGIRSRRTTLDLDYIRATRNKDPRMACEASRHSNPEMAAAAGRLALERAGVGADAIGWVIAGSCVAEGHIPAEASCIAAELGIEAPAFDLNAACVSPVAQLDLLARMDPELLPDFVLLAHPESMTRSIDYSDRSTAVLWGDAAAALVLSTREPAPPEILGARYGSRPSAWKRVCVPRFGHFTQEGRTVQAFAIRKSTHVLESLTADLGAPERRGHFVGHQANRLVLEAVCRACGIPSALHHSNLESFGNTGAASTTSILSMRWAEWGPDDDVSVVAVGSGLAWGGYLVRFGPDTAARRP